MDQLAPLHPTIQNQSYCGNIPRLLDYMIHNGLNTIPTSQIRTWLSNNTHCIPHGILLDTCHIDHIIPKDIGGIDHPYNYFIMNSTANSHFRNFFNCEKLAYIGKEVSIDARNFAKWVISQALSTSFIAIVNCNQFDAVRKTMKMDPLNDCMSLSSLQDDLLNIYNDIVNTKNIEEVYKIISTLPIKAKKSNQYYR